LHSPPSHSAHYSRFFYFYVFIIQAGRDEYSELRTYMQLPPTRHVLSFIGICIDFDDTVARGDGGGGAPLTPFKGAGGAYDRFCFVTPYFARGSLKHFLERMSVRRMASFSDAKAVAVAAAAVAAEAAAATAVGNNSAAAAATAAAVVARVAADSAAADVVAVAGGGSGLDDKTLLRIATEMGRGIAHLYVMRVFFKNVFIASYTFLFILQSS
jgi:hypothetical protein